MSRDHLDEYTSQRIKELRDEVKYGYVDKGNRREHLTGIDKVSRIAQVNELNTLRTEFELKPID